MEQLTDMYVTVRTGLDTYVGRVVTMDFRTVTLTDYSADYDGAEDIYRCTNGDCVTIGLTEFTTVFDADGDQLV